MEFCYFESHTLDTLKKGLLQTFGKYFTGRDKGKIDFDNCKILYSRLSFLTPRQAADERLWAGLCHGTFYGYVR